MTEIITITTKPILKQKLDMIRGDTSRSKFITKLVEKEIARIEKSVYRSSNKKLENISFAGDIFQEGSGV